MDLKGFTEVGAMLKVVRDRGIKKMGDFGDGDCFVEGYEF